MPDSFIIHSNFWIHLVPPSYCSLPRQNCLWMQLKRRTGHTTLWQKWIFGMSQWCIGLKSNHKHGHFRALWVKLLQPFVPTQNDRWGNSGSAAWIKLPDLAAHWRHRLFSERGKRERKRGRNFLKSSDSHYFCVRRPCREMVHFQKI